MIHFGRCLLSEFDLSHLPTSSCWINPSESSFAHRIQWIGWCCRRISARHSRSQKPVSCSTSFSPRGPRRPTLASPYRWRNSCSSWDSEGTYWSWSPLLQERSGLISNWYHLDPRSTMSSVDCILWWVHVSQWKLFCPTSSFLIFLLSVSFGISWWLVIIYIC